MPSFARFLYRASRAFWVAPFSLSGACFPGRLCGIAYCFSPLLLVLSPLWHFIPLTVRILDFSSQTVVHLVGRFAPVCGLSLPG